MLAFYFFAYFWGNFIAFVQPQKKTMMRKLYILLLLSLLSIASSVKAQTNIQEMYDFNRQQMTTTLEMFQNDDWGSTFFFVDIYHHFDKNTPTDFYTEIARSFNFWKGTAMKDFSLHAEWNGGCGIFNLDNTSYGGYPVNNAWLFGAEYCVHSDDYSRTLTLEVLYKNIRGGHSQVPMQFTAVWGLNDIFGAKGLNFSGFADFWWEDQTWVNPSYQPSFANLFSSPTWNTHCVFISEPQLWYNVGQFFNCNNLFIGGELEVSCHFSGNAKYEEGVAARGFKVNPAAGIKWNF